MARRLESAWLYVFPHPLSLPRVVLANMSIGHPRQLSGDARSVGTNRRRRPTRRPIIPPGSSGSMERDDRYYVIFIGVKVEN
jgi:hypothetical protein